MIDLPTGIELYPRVDKSNDQTGSSIESKKSYPLNMSRTVSNSIYGFEVTSFANEVNKTDETPKEIKNSINTTNTTSFDKLYFKDEFITSELRTSVSLLKTSQSYVEESLINLQKGKRKESDEKIMQFKQFLPELFCCRTISESFGAIINAIHNALINLRGQPLSEKQIIALHKIITSLLREPAMSFEKAVECVSEFEDVDFEVESVGLENLLKLVEMLDSEK